MWLIHSSLLSPRADSLFFPPQKGFLVRLVVALVKEALRFFGSDSVFLDSPLSAAGMGQAAALGVFLGKPRTANSDAMSGAEEETHALIRGLPPAPPSVICASNLRRAVATAGVALAERIRRTGEARRVRCDRFTA